jgi:methionyl aminopeptidase
MSADTAEELDALRAAGAVVAETIRAMRRAVRPGVTTRELDDVAAAVFRRVGARSGPQLDYGFPGMTCISVNDEAVHGIPRGRRLREGDLVKLDVTAELDGFYADACESVVVGRGRKSTLSLIAAARDALRNAMAVATTGAPLNAIGAAIESTVNARGYSVRAELNGLVLTIEPIIAAGAGAITEAGDGWTHRTADGSLSAHAEHTLVIREGRPLVLTA